MKVVNLILVLLLGSLLSASAQTNLFQANGRDYWVNRAIPGATVDNGGFSYVLLHEAYVDGSPTIEEHYVFGKISAIRGGVGGWNRKINVEVNSASTYNSNTATLISYNEYTRLVLVTYAGKRYLAIEIANASTIYGFSFTGYTANELLKLVNVSEISDRAEYNTLATPYNSTFDHIGIQGNMSLGEVGIPAARFDIFGGPSWTGSLWAKSIKVHAGNAIEISGETQSFGLGASGSKMYFFNTNLQGQGLANYFMIIDGDTRNMGIGIDPVPGYKLLVNGAVGATKIKVQQGNWADYVFHDDYKLPSLYEVDQYIRQEKHLPGIPTEAVVKAEGVDVGEMNKKLLQKIEELTLYMIEMKKENDALKARVEKLEQQ
ncbi:hypothetical protein [Chitinophaga sp. Cy-1792]|uniref:hypothetical protein n=1 Tax=Chitinophaga sp. Cy-1792 TaxID=2608339 RepID=UPI0014201634|nr:hypothetical protein [Chitinophaga sp. Cy-1792]NIG53519.1 hypothetical protein [Chitinophaga sp. Cy-1792]